MIALKSITNLERAEFLDNDIEGLPDYFKLIFETFPKLKYLDNKDREGNEVELDNEDYVLAQGEEEADSVNSDNMEFPEDEKGEDYDDESDDENYE